jgi:subtilisin family serine protease
MTAMTRNTKRIILFLAAYLSTACLALAQTKIEVAISGELRNKGIVRVIIVTRPDPDQAAGGMSLASPSGYLSGRLGSNASNVRTIGGLPAATAEITEAALSVLREDPNVVLVTRDIPMPVTLMDSVRLVGGDKAHATGLRGTDRTVAVLDTGIESNHPMLSDAIVAEACFSTRSSAAYQVKSLCPNEFDMSLMPGSSTLCPSNVRGCDHGTHVAGIVAGRASAHDGKNFSGVAPAAKVLPVQVFTLFTGDPACMGAAQCVLSFTSDQLRALEWVYKNRETHKVAAINMSLGSGYYDQYCDSTSALTEIIERLRAKGIATVIAAGNESYYDGVSEPACISSAISVSATRKDGELDVQYSNVSRFVRIAAPGTAILSSVSGSKFGSKSGTSMAAPHVAAAFALLRQKYPNDTVTQLEKRLLSGAPIVVDQRTGLKLPRLEVAHATTVAATTATPAASAETIPPPTMNDSSVVTAQTGSFIIRSDKPAEELRSQIENACPDLDCAIKRLGNNTFKLDVTPKAPDARNSDLSKEDVERLLNDRSLRVFDNRLSRPLRF